jgi:hypothetical protein
MAKKESHKGGKPAPKKQAAKPVPRKTAAKAKKSGPPKKEKPVAGKEKVTRKTYTVTEFADITYLTEHGVTEWLKQGLLAGQQNENGDWLVAATNLDVPNVKRLVREQKAP